MESEMSTFFERFVAALGQTVDFLWRWAFALASELLAVVFANLGTISLAVLIYVSYRLLRAGLGPATPNYRQVGSRRRSMSAASMSMRFSTPGYLCLLAAIVLLFVMGNAPSALFSFLMVAGGVGLVWWGYSIHAADPVDGALASTEPRGLWLNREIRAVTFVVVGLFVALLALSSLNTQVVEQSAAFGDAQQERADVVDQGLGQIVELIEEAMAPAAVEEEAEESEESQQALAPEL